MFTKIKEWPARKKIIAAVIAVLLVAGVAGGTLAWSSHQTKKNCAKQTELFGLQNDKLDKAIADAKAALELATKPAPYADGYALSDEGKAQIEQLNKAVDKAEKSKADSSKPGCATRSELKAITGLTGDRGKTIDGLNSSVEQFSESLGKWRLGKASEQAKAGMDKAKTDIEQARKDADGQIAAVDEDSSLSVNGQVKAAYDELKKAKESLAEPSFEVKAENYDEAAATIKNADELNKKIADLNAKTRALADAIAAARAPQTQPAQNQVGTRSSQGWNGGAAATNQSYGGGASESNPNLQSGFGSTRNWGSSAPNKPADGPLWIGQLCPNHPGADSVTYRASKGWDQASASADCGKPVGPTIGG
ncbi:hypothetical protein HMPREF9306_01252 [Propionimicrobium lymphophilum ACS-093-V-SCH5]|uniref:Colicin transporter n=1 Tax=Propionimicrobium lymphophilum ACS-093-V-SCH5 TaxID=883161 RepID=S2WYX2_9ACTN|nr:hypothetical protein [Propionimicrobium lymphophilum]EPD32944.1 hypothetical protein HMPREF9306_01252 [Propionimicrobium lymphophilum ACS-093-V-SCH5]